MKYLISGGAGFLGTNLCLRLLGENHQVVAVDDLSTAFGPNIEMLSKKKGFKLVKHDITEPLPDMGRFDFIYNLACPASPSKYQKNPLQTFRTSLWGVWNILQYAKKTSTPVFQASTSEIYGDPLVHPQNEDYRGNVNPIGVRGCYDEGKRAAETLLVDFHRTYSHPIKIARIFNTFGPYMDPDDGRVISNFIMQIIRKKPITIYGTGKQSRSFCYVDDMIEGFVRLEKSPKEFTGPVNLGSESQITLIELADALEGILGEKAERIYRRLPSDDPRHRRPDTSLAKKTLGWEARTTLEDGLRKSIDYFRRFV